MGTCTHVVFAGGPIPGVDTRSRLSARLAALDVARVVAADSGLELADALGVDLVPGRDRVVGDMDSLAGPRLGAALESGIDVERFPVDKDATDLALALDDAAAAAGSGDRLLVIATRSGRLDHMLATVPLLAAAPYDDYERDAWVDDDTLHVVRGLRRLTLQPGATMSALAAECAADQGLFWPYHDRVFQMARSGQQGATQFDDLVGYAAGMGMDEGRFRTCLSGQEHRDTVSSSLVQAQQLQLQFTPSVIVGDTLLQDYSFPSLSAEIDRQLAQAS